MLRVRGRSIKVRKPAVVAALLIVLLLILWIFFNFFHIPAKPDLSPDEAIGKALKKSSEMKSYDYYIKMTTFIDGDQQVVNEINGERQDSTHLHFKGKMYDSDVDFYLIGNESYNKEQLTGEWIKMNDLQLNQQDIFMQEINPLASFSYKELKDAVFTGAEDSDNSRYWVYTATPVIDNPYMEVLWTNFKFTFWVEPGSLLIKKAEISADSKNKAADKLNLMVQLDNYNSHIEVKPPQI